MNIQSIFTSLLKTFSFFPVAESTRVDADSKEEPQPGANRKPDENINGHVNNKNSQNQKLSEQEAIKYFDMAKKFYDRAQKGETNLYSKAFACLYHAGLRHHIEAQYNLGLMYELGLGITPSLIKAEGWFKLASDNGCCEAKIALNRIRKKMRQLPY